MAANSKRELIILKNIEILENIPVIKKVTRTLLSISELKNYPTTLLPLIAVVGNLPEPIIHRRTRDGEADQFKSKLQIDYYVYFLSNEDMDSNLSNLLDDLWVALYSNQSRSNLCLNTKIENTITKGVFNPYVAFKMTSIHEYIHDTKGI